MLTKGICRKMLVFLEYKFIFSWFSIVVLAMFLPVSVRWQLETWIRKEMLRFDTMMLIYNKSNRGSGAISFHDGVGCPPSTGSSSSSTNFFFDSNSAKLPSLCMFINMSQPPINSLLMYSCGIVGQSEYSLIPAHRRSVSTHCACSAPNEPLRASWRLRVLGSCGRT